MSKKNDSELNIDNEEYIKELFSLQKNKPIYKMLWPEEFGYNSTKLWNERFISVFENINNYKIFKKFMEGKRWNYNDFNKMNNFIKDLFEMNFYDWRDFSAFIYSKQYRKYVETNYSYIDIFGVFNIYDKEKNNDTFLKWSNLLDKAKEFLDDKKVPSGADPLLYIVYLQLEVKSCFFDPSKTPIKYKHYYFTDYVRNNPDASYCYIFGEDEEIYDACMTESFETETNYMEYVMLKPDSQSVSFSFRRFFTSKNLEYELTIFPWSKKFIKRLLKSETIDDFINWKRYNWKHIYDPNEIKDMLIERKKILREFYDNYETRVVTKKKIIYNSNSAAANSNNNVDDDNSSNSNSSNSNDNNSSNSDNSNVKNELLAEYKEQFFDGFIDYLYDYRTSESFDDYEEILDNILDKVLNECKILDNNITLDTVSQYDVDNAPQRGYDIAEDMLDETFNSFTDGCQEASNDYCNTELDLFDGRDGDDKYFKILLNNLSILCSTAEAFKLGYTIAETMLIDCFKSFTDGYKEAINDYNNTTLNLIQEMSDKRYIEIIEDNLEVLYSTDAAFDLGYKTAEDKINLDSNSNLSSNSSSELNSTLKLSPEKQTIKTNINNKLPENLSHIKKYNSPNTKIRGPSKWSQKKTSRSNSKKETLSRLNKTTKKNALSKLNEKKIIKKNILLKLNKKMSQTTTHTGGSINSSNISHNVILGMIILLASVLGIK